MMKRTNRVASVMGMLAAGVGLTACVYTPQDKQQFPSITADIAPTGFAPDGHKVALAAYDLSKLTWERVQTATAVGDPLAFKDVTLKKWTMGSYTLPSKYWMSAKQGRYALLHAFGVAADNSAAYDLLPMYDGIQKCADGKATASDVYDNCHNPTFPYFRISAGVFEEETGPIPVRLFIDALSVQKTTESGEDEVYIEITGQKVNTANNSTTLLPTVRQPFTSGDDSDYYEFVTGPVYPTGAAFRNSDEVNVGRPSLYIGDLSPGQRLSLIVQVKEDDDAIVGTLRTGLLTALDTVGNVNAAWKPYTEAAKAVASQIPNTTSDDVLGAFAVVVENKAGRLESVWMALDVLPNADTRLGSTTTSFENTPVMLRGLTKGGSTNVAFDLKGTSSSDYDIVVKLEGRTFTTETLVLGSWSDTCISPTVRIEGIYENSINVNMGQTFGFHPLAAASGWWIWYCGDNMKINADCRDYSNYVVVKRPAGSLAVNYTCMREIKY